MTEYGIRLLPQHQEMLSASAIATEHARARGYISLSNGDKKRLEQIGITPRGRNIPGLLVPLLRKDGSTWVPNPPRVSDSRRGEAGTLARLGRPRLHPQTRKGSSMTENIDHNPLTPAESEGRFSWWDLTRDSSRQTFIAKNLRVGPVLNQD